MRKKMPEVSFTEFVIVMTVLAANPTRVQRNLALEVVLRYVEQLEAEITRHEENWSKF